MNSFLRIVSPFIFGLTITGAMASPANYIFEVPASTKEERTFISNLGFAIDEVQSDRVFIMGDKYDKNLLKRSGLKFTETPYQPRWDKDERASKYRSYNDVVSVFKQLAAANPDLVTYSVLGKSYEGRDQPMLRISGVSPGEAESGNVPAILYQGCHHAREHLSVEVPVRFAEYLLANYKTNSEVKRLVDGREIFIVPVVNPDGFFYDYTNGISGRNWRKNRKPNADGSMGTDLNRNYSFGWGGGGASDNGSNDTYRGSSAFSEIEVQNIRDFVKSKRHRMDVVLDFHSFSELILYPWGYKYGEVENFTDKEVFKKMGAQMATWNGYKPEPSNELYIASGVSLDYFYGELGMTAFTFELSPNSIFSGGFYLSPNKIENVFNQNLKPMLYLLEFADDPKRALTAPVPEFLKGDLGVRSTKLAKLSDVLN